ncbi:RHS domain-containing protein [Inquilinus limosus]|uniref:RHS repeat-associated core domain-containing protein n=1 Tax=Inquilinus limosus TaxID=171674 RepID=UPI003F16CAA9
MALDPNAVGGVIARGGNAAHTAQSAAGEHNALDVWTHTAQGAGRQGATGSMDLSHIGSTPVGDIPGALAGQAGSLVDAVKAIGAADGALATTGATFAALTSAEQLLSIPFSAIPFPALPAVRILDMAIGLPHAHSHPPNLIPPAPPIPLPSFGPVIPIPFLSGASTVLINGMPAGRCLDMGLGIWCGGYFPMYEIFLGSSSVWIEGMRAARLGVDITKHCVFSSFKVAPGDPPLGVPIGTTVTASPNVIIGGVPMPSLTAFAIGAAMKGIGKGLGKLAGLARAGVKSGMSKLPRVARAVDNLAAHARGLGTRLKDRIGKLLGDPVDMATGDWVDVRTDIEIPGVLPLELTRVHRSGCDVHGALGRRWYDSWSQHLIRDFERDAVIWVRDDSAEFAFPWPGRRGIGENPLLPRLRLEVRGGEARIVDIVDGSYWAFATPVDGPSPITAIGDRHGNRIDFERESKGHLRTVRHTDGHELSVETDEAGRILAVDMLSDPTGQDGPPLPLVRYGYDERGHLESVDSLSGGIFRYRTDDEGRVIRWADSLKTWSEIDYDESGRVVATRAADDLFHDRYEYDDGERLVRQIAANGAVTTFRSDQRGQVVERIDAEGGIARQEWSERGELLVYVDELGHRTEYGYDGFGNRTEVRYPDGARETVLFDGRGRQAGFVDAAGNRWVQECDADGNPHRFVDPLGGTTGYHYDGKGRIHTVTKTTGPDAPVTVIRLEYDAFGRIVGAIDPGGGNSTVARDRLGRILSRRDPLGATIGFAYDTRGNMTEAVLADGTRITAGYDSEGNLVWFQNGEGYVTRYTYGAFDLLRTVIDAKGGEHRYEYDGDRRLTAIVNPKGERASLVYDRADRLIEETDFGGRTYAYQHDAAGRVVRRIEPDGAIRRYVHDLAGRVVEEITDEGTRRFAYEARGLLAEASLNGHVVLREHDALGRVIAETQDGVAVRSRYDGAGGRVELKTAQAATGYAYDPSGLLAAVSLGSSGELTFGRDLLGRETVRYDQRGFALRQSWDALGRIARQRVGRPRVDDAEPLGSGGMLVDRRWHYDRVSNPVAIEDSRWPALHYVYDGNGQIVQAAPGRPRGSRYVEAYAYDAARNLAGRKRLPPEAEEQSGGDGETMRPVASWRPGEGWVVLPGGAIGATSRTRYLWDRRGRLIEKHRSRDGFRPQFWRFHWDDRDRLVGVETPEHGRWLYLYDALDRRIEKRREGGGGARYLWDGDVVVEEEPVNQAGVLEPSQAVIWTYAPGSPVPVAKRQGERVWYVVADQIGTPRELVTADGRLAWAAVHDTWGAVNDNATPDLEAETDCPIRFPGQWHDSETGLHYNRFRVYDPETGQYLSPDPIGLNGGLRPHGYVTAPTTGTDPKGLSAYLRSIEEQLAKGKRATITVKSREDAEAILREYTTNPATNPMGAYRNTTHQPPPPPGSLSSGSEFSDWLPGGRGAYEREGTYHWDEFNPQAQAGDHARQGTHLQIHNWEGKIIRIFIEGA